MLKLILRQFWKHRNVLGIILLFWLVSGYFIFNYQNIWFGALLRWWTDEPSLGEQKPEKAYPYLISARERISDARIDLKLMRKSCQEFLPLRYRGKPEDYRPHWLAKLRYWQNMNLEADKRLDARVVEPDLYWKENHTIVMSAFKDLVDALDYAYEIPPDVHQQSGSRQTIILAAEIQAYAEAICQPTLARLIWGDYAAFQEERQLLKIKRQYDMQEYDQDQVTQNRLILEGLQGNPLYSRALREYIAGAAPMGGNEQACQSREFKLQCLAPLEAITVYQKLIFVEEQTSLPFLHLNLARTYQLQHRRRPNPEYLQKAYDHYRQALLDRATEQEALFELTELLVAEQEYQTAYQGLQRLELQSKQIGFPMQRYRSLARRILIALKRYQDADCFAEMSDLNYGVREHCLNFRL